ncbi:MAG: LexA family transcriptional regulator [Thermomicrobiales bacterium]|jgi:SOS regulatory protein LexA|nr:MAG: LexA family transcriptional regulator [Thermomicrobiales bacterium]
MNDEKYLAALRTYWKRHQAFPSMAKLCEVLGLASTSAVFGVIARLVDAGFLERTERRIAPSRKFFARPVVTRVRAGLPEPASQDDFEVLTIDDYLIDDPNRTVLCRVRGDSMKDVGLLDGDIAVVERNSPTAPGDIVVAVIDGEMTVKTLRQSRGKYWLQPANSDYPDIKPAGSLEIVGVVIGSFRKGRR